MASNGFTSLMQSAEPQIDYWNIAKKGVIGGLFAGILLLVFEIVYSAIARSAALAPFRMIAAIPLGSFAFDGLAPLSLVISLAVAFHLVYSIFYGGLFALSLSLFPILTENTILTLISGFVYGLCIWILNFYVVSPTVGWVWFAQQTDWFWDGFFSHGIVFGLILGGYLAGFKAVFRPY